MLAFFNNVKNFVAKNGYIPLFQGICFDGKRAIATNTHVMIIATNFPSSQRIIHFKTGELIEGKFPDIDKAIPKKTESIIVSSEITKWIAALKIAMAISKKGDYQISSFSTVDHVLSLKTKLYDQKFEAVLPIDSIDGRMPDIAFNTKYMHDILIFLKDANVKTFTLGYNGPLEPMKFTADKEVLAVLTPVRTE